MNKYGIVFNNINEFHSVSQNFSGYGSPAACVFPIEVVRENICHNFFMNLKNRQCHVGAEIDISKTSDIELCSYLCIDVCFFKLSQASMIQQASNVISSISQFPKMSFVALVSDFNLWVNFQTLCGNPHSLYASPEITADCSKSEIWKTATVFSVRLLPEIFLADFSMTQKHRQLLVHFLMRNEFVFVSADFQNLEEISQQIVSINQSTSVSPYLFTFQDPMQTISVDLTSNAYEIFEADNTKYNIYIDAIKAASEKAGKPVGQITLAVVGAGRGPLVDCAISLGITKICVIEKNHNAAEFLRQRKTNEWPTDVRVIEGDVRRLELSDKFDIIVSELLGSLGDNELAPECLLPCQNILSENGVMIPQNFSSVLVPLMSEFMWTKALNENKLNNVIVVSLDSSLFLGDPKKCFEFNYPSTENSLYDIKKIVFDIKKDGIVHGFGGWFISTLFEDVIMSTSPIDGTDNMFSWFPSFIPLSQPTPVKSGEQIELIFARKTNGKSVWYEWATVRPFISRFHNPGGISYSIGMYQ